MSRNGREMPRWSRLRAFTLIEVLVVVSIIAVLVAVLLPSLAKARDETRRILCASNQKQIATAVAMYAQAYKGFIPYSVPAFNASLTWAVWQEYNNRQQPGQPYFPPKGWVHLGLLYGGSQSQTPTRGRGQINDPRIFYCPSYNEFPHVYPDGWNNYVAANTPQEKTATSYTYALNGQVNKYPKGVRTTARLEQLKTYEALYACVFIAKADKRQRYGVWPHRGGVNTGYSDGSVRLAHVDDKFGQTAVKLFDTNNITDMDYFAFCFFRMLSGDRRWMNAFPNLPNPLP